MSHSEPVPTTGHPRKHHIVLYDGECPLCTFQKKALTWLDWGDRVRFVAIKDEEAKGIAPQLTRDDLLEAIHCVTPEHEIHRGARAIRFLGLRMPLLFPLGLFLWLPGVIYVAELVYRFVSRHRLVFSRLFGCKGACAIMPERRRE
ncbi:MAG: DUF393 domain-containing protein [Verrucomicrobiota bacterium]